MIEDPKQDSSSPDDLAFPRPEQPPMDDAAAGPTGDTGEDGESADPQPEQVPDALGDFA